MSAGNSGAHQKLDTELSNAPSKCLGGGSPRHCFLWPPCPYLKINEKTWPLCPPSGQVSFSRHKALLSRPHFVFIQTLVLLLVTVCFPGPVRKQHLSLLRTLQVLCPSRFPFLLSPARNPEFSSALFVEISNRHSLSPPPSAPLSAKGPGGLAHGCLRPLKSHCWKMAAPLAATEHSRLRECKGAIPHPLIATSGIKMGQAVSLGSGKKEPSFHLRGKNNCSTLVRLSSLISAFSFALSNNSVNQAT